MAGTPSHRNRQVTRILTVLMLIHESPRTIQELAVNTGVTTRTIRRDIEALEAAGFALFNERHDDGAVRWHLLGKGAPARRVA